MEGNPLLQVIIALIVLLLMGYVAYNIYVIELHKMFAGDNNIKKEINIIDGIYDYSANNEWKHNTVNKLHNSYYDISPSINQSGGAEYSYNFWLYIDQDKITNTTNNKDIALFLRGEKQIYFNNNSNFNCFNVYSAKAADYSTTLITKSPLVRLAHDGKGLIFEYNNLITPDSYRNNFDNRKCNDILSSLHKDWNQRNKNLIGISNIKFNRKWFMVTIVLKEISDPNDILTNNRALCKIYVNGMLMYENKVETIYGPNSERRSATPKHIRSPFYINPNLNKTIIKDYSSFFNTSDLEGTNILKIGDLKYFNYAVSEDIITSIYNKGLNQNKAVKKSNFVPNHNAMVSYNDIEDSNILKVP